MQEFTGIEYLKIDIANNFGLDKKKWHERINWFNENESNIDQLIKQAEKPALFYAGLQAYRDALAGKPIGYPISLDATSSGLQILSVLTGDKKAAKLCNVVPTGNREDAYKVIFELMVIKLNEKTDICKEDIKRAILTALYGSEAVPKEIFGTGSLLQAFLTTMHEYAPDVWELNTAFLSFWNPKAFSYSWVLPDNFHVHTKVMGSEKEVVHFLNEPFDIYTKKNMPVKEGKSLGANVTHSVDGMIVREMLRRCYYNSKQIERLKLDIELYENTSSLGYLEVYSSDSEMVTTLWNNYLNSGYLSARILDYLNLNTLSLVQISAIKELINSLPKKPFQLLTIHDSFRCLPHYANDLRRQYNLQLALIAKSNMLQYLLSQILNRAITINKQSSFYNEILDADYTLS